MLNCNRSSQISINRIVPNVWEITQRILGILGEDGVCKRSHPLKKVTTLDVFNGGWRSYEYSFVIKFLTDDFPWKWTNVSKIALRCLSHFVLELSAYPLATLGWLCHYRIPLSKLFYSQISCFIKLCIKVTKNCTENIIDIDFLLLALTFSCSTSFYIYYAKYGSPRCCRMQIQIQIWKGCRKQYSLWQGVIHKVRNYG